MISQTPQVQEVTAPSIEPVSLTDAKQALEIASETTAHDALLERLIIEARQAVESDTGLVSTSRTLREHVDNWPDLIELHRRPVISVTSVTYIDTAGVTQTLAAPEYVLVTSHVRPLIRPAYGASWPSVRGDMSGIAVTYVAGFATREAIPETFRQAVMMRLAQSFDDRTGDMWDKRERAYSALIHRLMRSSYP